MKAALYILAGLIVYTYLGYPLLLLIISGFKRKKPTKDDDFTPTVSLVIAAYNEEQVLRDKLDNCLSLDYPPDKLEVIVVSDGSTDRTDEIARSYADRGVIFKRLNVRRGKTAAQNEGFSLSRNDVIVFSDANGIYQSDAIRKLVRNLSGPEVGAVSGRLRYVNPRSDPSGESEILYWRHESFIKSKEGQISSVVGANGSIYALRRELYVPLDEDLISDLVEPIKVVEGGHRVVYEPEAISVEATSHNLKEELRRKVRIVARGFGSLRALRATLNPFRFGMFSIELISHKLLRWTAPWLLVGAFIINVALASAPGVFYKVSLILQVAFYATALVGYLAWGRRRFFTPLVNKGFRVLYLSFYFCAVNLAAALGLIEYLRGEKRTTWDTVRHPTL